MQDPNQEQEQPDDESSIIKLNIPVNDLKLFDSNMEQLGYSLMSDSFLVKDFNGIQVNITRRNGEVDSITGYQNNETASIPEEVVSQVKNDIQQSL